MQSKETFTRQRVEHWDGVARRFERRASWGRFYHRRLREIYRFLVSPGQRVLEVGCGQGNLLAALEPSYGMGIDFSPEMIRQASQRHPELVFLQGDAECMELDEKFDVIILSDLVNDLWDVQCMLECVSRLCLPHTRVI